MFGNKSQPSRIYSYGAKAPIIGADLVEEQMRSAHRYRNELVELELKRRKLVDDALVKISPYLAETEKELAALTLELDASRQEIKGANKKARTRVETPEAKRAAKESKDLLKKLRARRKLQRQITFASDPWKAAQTEISAWATEEQKRLRAACGLYWGTYLHVEQSMASAKSGAPPRFHRWTGEGHLAVQIIKGMSIAEAHSNDTRVRIANAERWSDISLRVGSNDDRTPKWATIPVRLHRPMPDNARIKWVHLIRRQVATRFQWFAQFVLSADEETWRKKDQAMDGAVAIDLGWRMVGKSMRIAYWFGDDGASDELCLPDEWLSQMRRVERIRSKRDLDLDAMKTALTAALRTAAPPDWLAAHAPHLHAWRSAARFAGLCHRWRDNRFANDEQLYDQLEEWRRRDRHLYEFEGNLRDQLQRRRLDIYRKFAATMRRKYRCAVIEDMDLRDFHVLPEAEEEPANRAIREHTRDACLSELVRALEESMAQTLKIDGKNTTARCWWCQDLLGVVTTDEWDRSSLRHTCSVCGTEYDQDECAARNLLDFASAEVVG